MWLLLCTNYGKAGLKFTYGSMQCAAVNTWVEDIKLAPQYWPELVLEGLNKAANQGHLFLAAGFPLTILKIVGTFLRICGSWQPERICCSCNLYKEIQNSNWFDRSKGLVLHFYNFSSCLKIPWISSSSISICRNLISNIFYCSYIEDYIHSYK